MMSSDLGFGLIYHSGLLGSFTSVVPSGEGDQVASEGQDGLITELGVPIVEEG